LHIGSLGTDTENSLMIYFSLKGICSVRIELLKKYKTRLFDVTD